MRRLIPIPTLRYPRPWRSTNSVRGPSAAQRGPARRRPDVSRGEASPCASGARADVCLVLEGTYPYVRGGVSAWTHDLIGELSDLRFSLVHVGPECGTYPRRHYTLPDNVTAMFDLYCRESLAEDRNRATFQRVARAERRRHAAPPWESRVLQGIRRLHLGDEVDGS